MDRIERYTRKDLLNIPSKKVFTNFGNGDIDVVELHVYGDDVHLQWNPDIENWSIDTKDSRGKDLKRPRINLDIHNDIRDLGFSTGIYTVQYNFFRNILGSQDENNGLHIAEISPSRKELRVRTTSDNPEFTKAMDNLIAKDIDEFVDDNWHDLILNLGENKTPLIINWGDGGNGDLLLKLYEPLPQDVEVKSQFWISKEVITSHTEKIKLIPAKELMDGTHIAGPNFELDVASGVGESGWETWDSILGTNKANKQSLLNTFISGSDSQTLLNIDYTDYANFVHFSSAKERLENFKYKIELIEYYNDKITQLGLITAASESAYSDANVVTYNSKITEIENGFDGYEKYLYFESSSYSWPKTNAVVPYTNDTVANTTTWFEAQANVALDYDTVINEHNLENTIPFHIREDKDNSNYLLFANMVGQHFDEVWTYLDYTSQIHSRQNKVYEGVSKDLVYNVLSSFGWESYQGFHFTDLWEYSLGLNSDGTYGNATSSLGTLAPADGHTQYIYASDDQKNNPISREELSRETWKRMLNNLPYLLKTKGTERGIRALITTYGLPPTLLRVFEYGGPQKERTTDSYVKYDKFSYSLEMSGSQWLNGRWGKLSKESAVIPGNSVNVTSANRTPDAFELRFNSWTPRNQFIITAANKWCIETEKHVSASNTKSGYYNYGRCILSMENGGGYARCSSSWLPIFDNDWWNIMVSRNTASYNTAQTFNLNLAKSADHSKTRMTHTSSVQMTVTDEGDAWNVANAQMHIGGDTACSAGSLGAGNAFSGSMQEYREWVLPDSDQLALDYWNELKPFYNHARSPLSIEGYGATGSYDQLVRRFSLGADLNRWSGSWQSGGDISSSAPRSSGLNGADPIWASTTTSSLTPIGWAGDLVNDWPTEEEKYYTAMPDLVGTREISDKVRIESSDLVGRLDARQKNERSQFDKAPLDSNRLGVYFAPHFNIDLDIAHDMGGVRFDNYVGNPLDTRDDEYKALRPLRQHYWKKHNNPYDFFDYLKILRHLDHTLFKQIEHLVPARANAQIGLLVKGNMLERPKVKQMETNIDELHYNGTLDISNYKIKANTTTLGGPYHRWLNPETNQWETGSAVQGHTGFLSGSEQSSGELEVYLNVRKHNGHDLDIDGSRYIWKYMHQYKQGGVQSHNVDAYMQQGGASYENNGTYLHNTFTDGYYGNTPSTVYGIAAGSPNALNAKSGSTAITPRGDTVTPFNDFGNIKNYHHQRMSRIYSSKVYHYFAPKNNMHNSASTGGVTTTKITNGYVAGDMYRSGLRPVSSSYEIAEVQDYRPHAVNNLYHGGCKLVGSDFNMPVLTTIDGGPVVEFTDTNANAITVGGRTAGEGDLRASAGNMAR